MTKILDIKTILVYSINGNLFKFRNISVNFKDTKVLDHILKISRPGVFDIRCLSWNTGIIVFIKKNSAWIKDDIKVVTKFLCLLGHPIVANKVNVIKPGTK